MTRKHDEEFTVPRRLCALLAGAAGLVTAACSDLRPAQPVTVAFIGDQGSGRGARAVLEMIKAQRAEIVLHQGDFDYKDDPQAWDALITDVLGANFPYFASIGNHDRKRWGGRDGYQAKLRARLRRIAGAHCSGDLGVMSACTYRGLFFVLSGVGTLPKKSPDDRRHVAYLGEQLARTNAIWRICSWHKNQTRMQTGGKHSDVGWQPYDTCRKAGAIIATGHEHAYSRTHLMDNFETQSVASTNNTLVIEKGKSFAFVSGLGGASVRDQERGRQWWASIYTSDQGADYGALFCTFNVNGDERKADCHFRDIRGRVPDRFSLISRVGADVGVAQIDTASDSAARTAVWLPP